MPRSFAIKILPSHKHTVHLKSALGLTHDDADQLGQLITRSLTLERNQQLFRAGEPFHNLYIVTQGYFKTHYLLADGCQQVTGIHMAGDLLGTHAIGGRHYVGYATALEKSQVCEIPFTRLEELSRRRPNVQHSIYRLLGQKILSSQRLMMMLNNLSADKRLLAFLLDLSERYAFRNLPPYHFQLHMTRNDISNYLGLTPETVSRSFSRLQKSGLIRINGREIKLLKPEASRQLIY